MSIWTFFLLGLPFVALSIVVNAHFKRLLGDLPRVLDKISNTSNASLVDEIRAIAADDGIATTARTWNGAIAAVAIDTNRREVLAASRHECVSVPLERCSVAYRAFSEQEVALEADRRYRYLVGDNSGHDLGAALRRLTE